MRWIVPLLLALAPAQAASAQSFHSTYSDGLSYVLMSGHGDSAMSGSSDDFRRARSLQAGGGPLLYVRDGGAAYVIRDAAILRRAQEIMRPQQALGARQGEIGNQQGELGRRQAALGQEQGRLGRLMANARLSQVDELGRQQGELGRRQSALGAQQAELGRRQAELGRQQARLAELAKPQLRALIAEARRRGVAQRVD